MVMPFDAPQPLRDLAHRYALAVDSRDAVMLSGLFTRDGIMRGKGQAEARYAGAEGFARMIAEVDASFGATMHNVFNQTYEQAADGTVTGHVTGIASHVLPGGEGPQDLTLLDFAMRYHDRYALDCGVWKFAERQLEVVWVERRKAAPFGPAMLGRELSGF